tara:strand:- start:223 stop:390 length:168 start_codon:yes stop_codon:yes gene_type:complete
MVTKFVCVKCGDDNIGRAFNGMQYINQDYFNEIFKFGNWDCQYCGEVDIKEIQDN